MDSTQVLVESRLFSFLHTKDNFLLYFFEGQKLIHDLALTSTLKPAGFSYFRDAVLSLVPLISLLKPQEALGLYVDSDDPFLRLKIEANSQGLVRTLLLPEELSSIPEKITGKARLSKILPEGRPYNSIVELKDVGTQKIVNIILRESYQIEGEVLLGNLSDQSILITKIPPSDAGRLNFSNLTLAEFLQKNKMGLSTLLNRALTTEKDIIDSLSAIGLDYLSSRQIKFSCGCSKERMMDHLSALKNTSHDELFEAGKESLEVKCDYCKKTYQIFRFELASST